MRQYLVAGNWKMNGSRDSAARLINDIIQGLEPRPGAEVLVCPPFVHQIGRAHV